VAKLKSRFWRKVALYLDIAKYPHNTFHNKLRIDYTKNKLYLFDCFDTIRACDLQMDRHRAIDITILAWCLCR